MYYKDEFPFHTAAITGDVDAMDIMYKKFGCKLDELNGSGLSPILLAAAHNQVEAVAYLIENGVDVNFADHISGATPLIAAILNGSCDVIEELYCRGCDLSRVDKEGKSPVHIACMGSANHIKVIRWLKSKSCDLHAQDFYGCTPLHTAAGSNNIECVKYLVQEYNAKVNAVAIDGTTPVYLAASKGYSDMIRLLISLGGNANITDNKGMSPCGIAALLGHFDAVKAIFDAGGNCVADNAGITPHDSAVSQGHVEVASFLQYVMSGCTEVCLLCRCKPKRGLFLKCKTCRKVGYCSRECQIKHFRAHKKFCRPDT